MNLKPFPLGSHYLVSDDGLTIKNTITGRILRPSPQIIKGKQTGYLYVSLLNIGDKYLIRMSVHRIVCMTFNGLPPVGKPWVNHKDGNKANNQASNLEWTSISENIQHAFNTGLKVSKSGKESPLYGKRHTKETRQKMSAKKKGVRHPKFKGFYIVDGVKWPSANQAAKYLNISNKTIASRCKDKPNKWGNFYFEPVENK